MTLYELPKNVDIINNDAYNAWIDASKNIAESRRNDEIEWLKQAITKNCTDDELSFQILSYKRFRELITLIILCDDGWEETFCSINFERNHWVSIEGRITNKNLDIISLAVDRIWIELLSNCLKSEITLADDISLSLPDNSVIKVKDYSLPEKTY